MFDIKFIKEFQIMKGALKVDTPITNKIGIECGPFFFVKIIIHGQNIRILGCMFSRIKFVHMPYEG